MPCKTFTRNSHEKNTRGIDRTPLMSDDNNSMAKKETSHISISVVVPVKDEADSVAAVIDSVKSALATCDEQSEIIIVDDGSTDGSREIAEQTGVRVISHGTGRGYGASLKTGIRNANGDSIVIIDGDGTYPAEMIPELLKGLETADMVVGARTRPGACIPLMRRPAKMFLTWLASFLSGVKIHDLNSGLRVFRREVIIPYLRVLPEGFSFTSTITLLMIGDGRPFHYIPIEYRKRAGKSKMVPSDAFSFLVLIIRTIMFFNPLKFFFPAGLVLFLVGGVKLLNDYIIHDLLSGTSVLLILSALQLWGLGFLAELLLFLERRRR